LEKKITYSLGLKLTIVVMLMSLTIGFFVVFAAFQIYNYHIFDRYTTQGEYLVQAASEVIEWDDILYYLETLDQDERYLATIAELRLLAESADAEYLFVQYPTESGSIYVYDTDNTNRRYSLGDFVAWSPEMREHLDELMAGEKFDPVVADEGFGELFSIYQPFTDSAGEVVGYLGADYSIDLMEAQKWEFISRLSVAMIAVSVVITLLFLIILTRLVIKPIKEITSAANDYLVEDEIQDEKSSIAKLSIKSKDELQLLTQSLQLMERKIKEYLLSLNDANRRASVDAMTGLMNRTTFKREVSSYLEQVRRKNGYQAYLMIDLDNFKDVNDTWGHIVGDEVLIACAHEIRSHFRSSDLVARLGGDEFAILYKDVPSKDELEKRITEVCNALRKLSFSHHEIAITVSGGAMISENKIAYYRHLYEHADKALYEAKEAGRDRYVIKH